MRRYILFVFICGKGVGKNLNNSNLSIMTKDVIIQSGILEETAVRAKSCWTLLLF